MSILTGVIIRYGGPSLLKRYNPVQTTVGRCFNWRHKFSWYSNYENVARSSLHIEQYLIEAFSSILNQHTLIHSLYREMPAWWVACILILVMLLKNREHLIYVYEKTTIIKTALKPRKDKDAYHLLDRPGQVVLARLRSGHNRLNAHMHRKLKIVPSPNVSLWWGGPDNRACSSDM